MNPQQRNTFLYIFCGIILVVGITLAIYFGVSSPPPPYSVQYPNCMQIQSPTYKKANLKLIGNGRCDRQVGGNMTYGLNTIECGYDDGDCDDFNEKYKKCDRNKHPSLLYDLGKGDCKVKYNIVECGYDDNLCADFNRNYPKCRTEKPGLVGDGKCNFDGDANTVQCRYDGGDCLNEDLPNCNGINIERLGDGRCHRELNTKDCDFDDGDCKLFNEEFPDCDVSKPYYLYDNVCDNGPPNRFGNKEYNNAECKYDGGACSRFNNQYGDDCYADDISLLGDGKCHNDVDYNSRACDIDGGDCVDFNNDPDYINCNVFNGKYAICSAIQKIILY